VRWDLVPRDFLSSEPSFPLSEILKKKNSRAKNPATGKSWGFDSYNARVETIASLASFKKPWQEGLRCILPTQAFKERPNMDGAPAAFKGKEYVIKLDGTYFLGGIYDTWERKSEKLDSCTIITMSSKGNAKIEGIWHERIPLILTEQEALRWLDPKTTPDQAMHMCKQLSADRMEISEVEKPAAKPKPESQQGSLFL
jgi:putative SOS response-associated peptidase YedK